MARTFTNWNGSARRGRQSKLPSTLDPAITTSALLRAYSEVNNDDNDNHRFGKFTNELNFYTRHIITIESSIRVKANKE